jgi:hypothetical protein
MRLRLPGDERLMPAVLSGRWGRPTGAVHGRSLRMALRIDIYILARRPNGHRRPRHRAIAPHSHLELPARQSATTRAEGHSGVTHHRRRRPDDSCLSAPVSQRLPRGEYDRTEYGGLPVTTAYSLMLLCGNRFPSYYLLLPAAAVVFSAPSHAAPACAVVPLRVPTRYVIAISRPWRGHRRPWQPAR